MTIRKRLFLSNLLMLVIPIVASAFLSYTILFIFTGGSPEPLERSFPEAFNLLWQFQKTGNSDALLDGARAFNDELSGTNIFLAVAHQKRLIYPEDAAERMRTNAEEKWLPALLEENITGTLNINNMRIILEQSGDYHLLIVDKRYRFGRSGLFGYPLVTCLFVIFGFLVLIIILTNRVLTRFVTKKITTPLNLLSNGTRQIKDGNLDHRIAYGGADEFAPVCGDFNEMADYLQVLIERQQRDEASRKELLAGVSHDLRTPLTSIKAYVEGLLDGVAEDYQTQLKYLGIVRAKAEDIDRIVDKLFLLSKLDMEEYPFYQEKLELVSELEEMLRTVQPEYKSKGLVIEFERPEAQAWIYADPLQLRNAVTNILENSVKYKDKDEAVMKIECQDLGDSVAVYMEDNGPGVRDEILGQLFGAFYRGDASRRDPSRGSGLGLAITDRIMRRMGGSIRAENAAEGGLRMIMTLPKYKNGEET